MLKRKREKSIRDIEKKKSLQINRREQERESSEISDIQNPRWREKREEE